MTNDLGMLLFCNVLTQMCWRCLCVCLVLICHIIRHEECVLVPLIIMYHVKNDQIGIYIV